MALQGVRAAAVSEPDGPAPPCCARMVASSVPSPTFATYARLRAQVGGKFVKHKRLATPATSTHIFFVRVCACGVCCVSRREFTRVREWEERVCVCM